MITNLPLSWIGCDYSRVEYCLYRCSFYERLQLLHRSPSVNQSATGCFLPPLCMQCATKRHANAKSLVYTSIAIHWPWLKKLSFPLFSSKGMRWYRWEYVKNWVYDSWQELVIGPHSLAVRARTHLLQDEFVKKQTINQWAPTRVSM